MKGNLNSQNYRQWNLPEGASVRLGKGSITGNIAYSPDGTRLVVPSSIGIWIYDAHTLEEVELITEHRDFDFLVLGFTLSGSLLVSGFGLELIYEPTLCHQTLGIWNEDTKHLKTIPIDITENGEITSSVFSPDGRTLATGSTDGKIRLWDVYTAELKNTFIGPTEIISSLVFSSNGYTLASGNKDGAAILWNVDTGERLTTLTEQMWGLVFNSNGSALAASLGRLSLEHPGDEGIGLWNVPAGNLSVFCTGIITSNLVFSPDGKMLVCAVDDRYNNSAIGLWDVAASHSIYPSLWLSGHTSSIRYLAFSPDGRTLASGSQDGTVLLWSVGTASASGPIAPSVSTPHTITDIRRTIERKKDYYEYLKSNEWKKLRKSVLRRDGELCICGAKATEVHHKTYARVGKEFLSDLVSLCRHCHQNVHDNHKIK